LCVKKGRRIVLWDRLGILTDEVAEDFTEALDWIAAQGLRHVELRLVDGSHIVDADDRRVREIRRMVEDRGLFVSAIASPLFKCRLDPTRPVAAGDMFGQKDESVDDHMAKLTRCIDIAKLAGTNKIRIFSFWRESDPAAHRHEIVHYLRKAAEEAARSGSLLLLENEPSCNGGYAHEIADLIRETDSPALRALWDPGNEAFAGNEAYPAGYEAIRPYLAHVHLKDAYIGRDGTPRCVPLGSGDVPVMAQVKALSDDGYSGLYTIETHFLPAGGSRKSGSKMTLEGLRALLEEEGTG
jgi:L-ribulose-5-phosphate 3-epimerase